jgi:hypothetical protein
MANRSFLLVSSSPDPDANFESADVVAASWRLPLLWFSLFDISDIYQSTLSRCDDEEEDPTIDNGDDLPLITTYPVLITTTAVALKRTQLRRTIFFSHAEQALQPLYDRWITLIMGVEAAYLHLQGDEIWSMGAPEQYDKYLQAGLQAFSANAPDGWSHLCWEHGISFDRDTQQISFGDHDVEHVLYGYWWERPVPWPYP